MGTPAESRRVPEEVATLAGAQLERRRRRRWRLRRRSSTSCCWTLAVVVVLAVGLVVLVVVRGEVGQGEPVVGGDEVDAGRRRAPVGRVDVAAAGQAQRQLAERAFAPARSRGRRRGTCRSTPTSGPGSRRPGSRRCPTARRSSSPVPAPGPGRPGSRRRCGCRMSPLWRVRVVARSKRNPSTCISVTQ